MMKRVHIIVILLSVVYLCSVDNLCAQSSSDILSYISQYKQIALEQEQKYGVPASITLAQGILESGAGKSMLTRAANNHFGIKKFGGWTGPIYLAWDDENKKSSFRKYDSAAASYRDHIMFLKNNSRYSGLFAKSVYDYRAWAIGLQKAGYATAGNYAKALIGFIDAYRLYSINGGVKLRPGKTVVIRRRISSTKVIFDSDCMMGDSEESEEEKNVTSIVNKFVVEINGVRCTLLYPGETLSSVSQKYNIPQAKLLEFNEVSNPMDFKEGDIVFLQKKKDKSSDLLDYYRVKENDDLYSISQHVGIKMTCLAKMNAKDLFSKLRVGEKLRLK